MERSLARADSPRPARALAGPLAASVAVALVPWTMPGALAQADMAAPLIEIAGHRSEVRFLRYLDPNGRAIISSSFDALVVWDADSGTELRRLIDGAFVFHFAVSPDGPE